MKLPKFKFPKFKLPKFGKGGEEGEDGEDEDEGFGEDFDPSVFSGEAGDGAAARAAMEEQAARAAAEAAAEAAEDGGEDAGDMPPSPASEGMPGGAEGMPSPSSKHHEDFDAEFDDDHDDEEGTKRRFANPFADPAKRKIAIAAAAGVVVLLGVGGGAWWFFAGDDGDAVNVASQTDGGALNPPGHEGDAKRGEGADGHAKDGAPAESDKGAPRSLNAIAQRDLEKRPGEGIVAPPVTEVAYAGLPAIGGVVPLPVSPDPALTERSAQGLLPKVGADGRQPWKVYARPFAPKAADLPRLAVIVTGLGLSAAATEAAIGRLPPDVTLAFDPYSRELPRWTNSAREHGHETLLVLPLESGVFPRLDPGTKALMTSLKREDNAVTLDGVLAAATGYVGVLTSFGSKFDQSEHHVKELLEVLKTRGLMIVDGGFGPKSEVPKQATQIGVPRAKTDLVRIEDPSPEGAMAYFARAEAQARKGGAAVMAVEPYPAVLAALVPWLATLEKKNIVVAPITAVADKQFLE